MSRLECETLFDFLSRCFYCCCCFLILFIDLWPSLDAVESVSSAQGNLVAIKHVNKKRIELTRQVLLELKHVSRGIYTFYRVQRIIFRLYSPKTSQELCIHVSVLRPIISIF